MKTYGVTFYKRHEDQRIAYRRLDGVPRVGDLCVFNEKRYTVAVVEWCLDVDATDHGTKINIELTDTEWRKDD